MSNYGDDVYHGFADDFMGPNSQKVFKRLEENGATLGSRRKKSKAPDSELTRNKADEDSEKIEESENI